MSALRLSPADQLLINLCGWLACQRYSPDPHLELVLEQTRRVLPLVNRGHWLIGPLADAAQKFLDGEADLKTASLWRLMDLSTAAQAVFYARAGQASAAVWPEDHDDFPHLATPSPASEPAHAAE